MGSVCPCWVWYIDFNSIFKCPHASLRESPVVEVKAYRCQGLVGVGLLQAFMFIFVALWFVFLASSLLSSLLMGEGAILS